MKLAPDMYHLNNFDWHRNEGGIDWAGGGCIQKTIKKCDEICIISALTRPNNRFKNAMKVRVF